MRSMEISFDIYKVSRPKRPRLFPVQRALLAKLFQLSSSAAVLRLFKTCSARAVPAHEHTTRGVAP